MIREVVEKHIVVDAALSPREFKIRFDENLHLCIGSEYVIDSAEVDKFVEMLYKFVKEDEDARKDALNSKKNNKVFY